MGVNGGGKNNEGSAGRCVYVSEEGELGAEVCGGDVKIFSSEEMVREGKTMPNV